MNHIEFDRRELLRIGGLSILGGGAISGGASHSRADGSPLPDAPARACIFILLQGGPSQLDLWDPKPGAPAEIRGPFQPIATSAPGIQFTEALPLTARIAKYLTVVRSMEHTFNNHIAGTYITLTGSDDQPNQDREAKTDDFPGPAAVLNYLQRTPPRTPVAVSLPTWLSIPGPSNRMPGQYAGFLGAVHDPFLISGEPHKKDFKPLSLTLPSGFSLNRMQNRWSLRQQLDEAARGLEAASIETQDRLSESAYNLLIDPTVREALDLSLERPAVRERYGDTKLGQSLLLARRLVEAGVRFVAYNAFNQEWDTHHNIAANYPNLVPPMDQAYSALVEDLVSRGMLDSTLVINAGEFGRTPVLNKDGGRDHWPNVYSVALAGGGLVQGRVYGESDSRSTQVASNPVVPADLLATMWHLLGIDPQTELRDRLNRPIALCRGRVIRELLG
jgi:hypothetical protein